MQTPDLSKQTVDHLLTVLPGHWALMRFPISGAFGTLGQISAQPEQSCYLLISAAIVTPKDPQPAAR